ncbi:MAG: ATP synthase F1 subunit delta [Holosporaceae bacterium]|jgi:F-type H+-transporting ATPase subunit delta|nr:ATP synthase F1 subunit delta [Holosporaceae bacterium]
MPIQFLSILEPKCLGGAVADSSLVNKYVRSLYAVAVELKMEEEVLRQLREMKGVIFSIGDFRKFLKKVTFLKCDGERLVQLLKTELDLSEIVGNFLDTLRSNGRLFMIIDVCEAYETLLNEVSGRRRLHLTFAKNISVEQEQALKKDLAEVFGEKTEYDMQYDSSLIDGFKIQYRSKILDYSALSKIKRLRAAIRRDNDEN